MAAIIGTITYFVVKNKKTQDESSNNVQWAAMSQSTGEFECSKECGGGTIPLEIKCVDSNGVQVADHWCGAEPDPYPTEECNTQPCDWSIGDWGTCSGGTRSRTVTCPYNVEGCSGGEPVSTESCAVDWETGAWGTCDPYCAQGTRTRDVTCPSSDPTNCLDSNKPVSTQMCTDLPDCDWALTNDTSTSTTTTTITRTTK